RHTSVVHASPSSSHSSPSPLAGVTGNPVPAASAALGCAHMPAPSHRSSVQTLPSSVQRVPAGTKQLAAASLHVSAHSGPTVQGSPACTRQTPALHRSGPLQNTPSLQGSSFGTWVQPSGSALGSSGSQRSVVQSLASSQSP